MAKRTFVEVDIHNEEHCNALISLLNNYMEDEMGIGESMPEDLPVHIINGLKKHSAYLGFFVCIDNEFVALANCNVNYSTWQARFLINIHDFIVHPDYRKRGVGLFLLEGIKEYAVNNNYCKINLEVRSDNLKAKSLYEKVGFKPGEAPMLFWQLSL